jgi:hypothetical protein
MSCRGGGGGGGGGGPPVPGQQGGRSGVCERLAQPRMRRCARCLHAWHARPWAGAVLGAAPPPAAAAAAAGDGAQASGGRRWAVGRNARAPACRPAPVSTRARLPGVWRRPAAPSVCVRARRPVFLALQDGCSSVDVCARALHLPWWGRVWPSGGWRWQLSVCVVVALLRRPRGDDGRQTQRHAVPCCFLCPWCWRCLERALSSSEASVAVRGGAVCLLAHLAWGPCLSLLRTANVARGPGAVWQGLCSATARPICVHGCCCPWLHASLFRHRPCEPTHCTCDRCVLLALFAIDVHSVCVRVTEQMRGGRPPLPPLYPLC